MPALLALTACPALADTGDHWTRAFSMPLFLLAISSPLLFGVLGISALVALGLHLRKPAGSPAPLWPQLALAVCAVPVLFVTMEGGAVVAAFWPMVLGILAHWHWRERRKGNPGFQPATPLAKWVGLAGVGLVMVQATRALPGLALIGWTTLFSPGPGEPPFARPYDGTPYARPLTPDYWLALHRFPDAAACLQDGADPRSAAGLARMDWTRITLPAEAEVCLFRLLASLPDGMAGFPAFAQAQGFAVLPDDFNPTKPFVELDGTLRVTAYWSIRRFGPKFPTHGLTRVFHAIPYSMSLDATYAPDDRRLLHVVIGFNTL